MPDAKRTRAVTEYRADKPAVRRTRGKAVLFLSGQADRLRRRDDRRNKVTTIRAGFYSRANGTKSDCRMRAKALIL
jgi:hypothetical protein